MKATETKFRSTPYLPCQLLSQVIWCLGALILICSTARAQNLFAVDANPNGGLTGIIDEFTPNGVRSIFTSGLSAPLNMAFDESGNLFVADEGTGALYKFTPAGVRTTFALGLPVPVGVAFDSAGNVFATEFGSGNIYKFTPDGVRTTFASGLFEPQGLAFDSEGNLFVAVSGGGVVDKFTPDGVGTTFASGLFFPFELAFDSEGNLFVADGGDPWDFPPVHGAVYKFTPSGLQSTIASDPVGLAIDSADNLFVATVRRDTHGRLSGSILKIAPSGVQTTFASGVFGALAFQPAQTPAPTPTPTPTPTATPTEPVVSLKASPTKVNKGGTATFTASASPSNFSQNIVVNFSTSGSAVNGTDYTLSANQITIPAGQSSGSVTFHVTTTKTKGKEKAIMTLQDGMGYAVITKNKANIVKVTIQNN